MWVFGSSTSPSTASIEFYSKGFAKILSNLEILVPVVFECFEKSYNKEATPHYFGNYKLSFFTFSVDAPQTYESAVRYAMSSVMIGNDTVGASGATAPTTSERGVSLNLLARKHRQAVRRDKKKGQDQGHGQGQVGAVTNYNNNKPVANDNKDKSQDLEVADYPAWQRGGRGQFPRRPSQERVFVLTGSVTDSTNTDKDLETVPSQLTDNLQGGAVIGQSHQQPQIAHPHHKITRKKLRWKEEGAPGQGGESCDIDDVFTAESDGSDNVSSATQTRGFSDIKSFDLVNTTSTVARCHHILSDNVRLVPLGNNTTKGQKNVENYPLYGNDKDTTAMADPRRKISDLNRKVPRLERQAAFSAADYSSSDTDSDEDCADNGQGASSPVYNVDLLAKGQGRPRVNQGHVENKKEDEGVYVPLRTVGKKVSTTIQYKSDDTYVPIWTTNVPKTKREIRTSESMDDNLLEGSDVKGQGHSGGERSPRSAGFPQTISLDVSANKTTHVLLKEKLPRQPINHGSQDQIQGQTQGQGHEINVRDIEPCDNNKNYNGHLRKLKLVYGATDLPQVHYTAKAKDTDQRPNRGQNLEPESIEIQVPSLLERRGILLKEASSEDRAPPLPIKHGRNLRSYEQLGRSLERSRSNRLHSSTTWDQQRSTDVPPGGQKGSVNRIPRDPADQSAGPLQKLKRHLSRSKSYR